MRFFNLGCVVDADVAHELLHVVVEWGRENQMVHSIGPNDFSDEDPQGLQVEGFELTD